MGGHMNRCISVLVVSLCLLVSPVLGGKQKKLRPLASSEQKVFSDRDTQVPIVSQEIDGAYVQASVIKNGDLFKVGVTVGNPSEHTIQIVQEKVFLLNAYG